VVQHSVHLVEKVQYAAKVVENKSLTDDENLEALETEIAILRKLEHPHIVGVKEVVLDKENTYIIMELLSGGEVRARCSVRRDLPLCAGSPSLPLHCRGWPLQLILLSHPPHPR